MASLRLPRLLAGSTRGGLRQTVSGSDVSEVLADLHAREPALRPHILDETGQIRPHVLIFVDGNRAQLDTTVGPDSQLQVLQAVSGG
jgi:hypothetical protein